MTTLTREPETMNVELLRERAACNVEAGAVTDGYRGDRAKVIELLDAALATELVCSLRYRRHYFAASGLHAEAVAREFLEHATEEQAHADTLAERIVQLGGMPDFSPESLTARSHASYGEATDLEGMLRENLVAERLAIETYREMIRFVGNDDPTTRRMLEDILAVEEKHADELASLFEKDRVR